jgi:tetratricopeptide (TPR) repeat protein
MPHSVVSRWRKQILLLFVLLLPQMFLLRLCEHYIKQLRREYQLTPTPLHPSLDVPSFIGTILLGGFRALAIDFLWMRSSTLQRKGEWWELRPLIELIAYLQPNQIQVWAFNAWNLAYNISVCEMDPQDQWRWVKEGMDFLRKGIEKNPQNYYLWWYLANIHMHKIPQNPYFEKVYPEHLSQAIQYAEKAVTLIPNHREFFQGLMLLKTCYSKQAQALETQGRLEEALIFWEKTQKVRGQMAQVNPHFKISAEEAYYQELWLRSVHLEKEGKRQEAIEILEPLFFSFVDTTGELSRKIFFLQDMEILEIQQTAARLQQEGKGEESQEKFEKAQELLQKMLSFWQDHSVRSMEFNEEYPYYLEEDLVLLIQYLLQQNQLCQQGQNVLVKALLKSSLEFIDEQYSRVPPSVEKRFESLGGQIELKERMIRHYHNYD